MGFLLIAFAVLGLLCIAANLLEVIGKIVVGFMKYIVSPALIFMLVMFVIYCVSR